jgi:hypothetical protein
MADIGVFTPEQARLLWLDYQERKQLNPQLQKNFPVRRPVDEPSPHRVFIKNTEDETLPAYGCVEVLGTVVIDGVSYVEVCKPTRLDAEYLFVSQFEIEADKIGWAYRYGVVRMLGDPPSEPKRFNAIVGSYEIEEGDGPFVVFGPDVIDDDVLIGRFKDSASGSGRSIEYVIISSEIASSGPYTGLPVATVRVYGVSCSMDTSLIGVEAEVVDHSKQLFDLPNMAGYYGWADEKVFPSLASDAEPREMTPCHWSATNRGCDIYDDPYAAVIDSWDEEE